jgi:hypothetical protein
MLSLIQRVRARRQQGVLHLDGRGPSTLPHKLARMTFATSRDDLAVKPFEREVTVAGRSVPGIDPVAAEVTSEAGQSVFAALASPLSKVCAA